LSARCGVDPDHPAGAVERAVDNANGIAVGHQEITVGIDGDAKGVNQ